MISSNASPKAEIQKVIAMPADFPEADDRVAGIIHVESRLWADSRIGVQPSGPTFFRLEAI